MNYDDTPVQHSAIERQLRCLVVPEPATYAPGKRLDVIHEPDFDLLWVRMSSARDVEATDGGLD